MEMKTKPKNKTLRSQGGQLAVEAILLLVVGVTITMMVSRFLQDKQYAQTLIAKPWSTLSGMIECGVWSGCGPNKHPGSRDRNISGAPNI
jgi:hypothetical protein